MSNEEKNNYIKTLEDMLMKEQEKRHKEELENLWLRHLNDLMRKKLNEAHLS